MITLLSLAIAVVGWFVYMTVVKDKSIKYVYTPFVIGVVASWFSAVFLHRFGGVDFGLVFMVPLAGITLVALYQWSVKEKTNS